MRESLKRFLPLAIGKYINFLAMVAPRASARKAFNVFSKPRRGKIGEHHTDFLNPARKDRLPFKNFELQTYHWPGPGKTVLLVHGWESHSHRYKALINRLNQAGYNIYTFDAPGHGYSSGKNLYVPLYEEALRLVKKTYRPAYIIAHSVGAMTAIYNAYKNPSDFVEKIVILGAPDKLEDLLSDYQKIIHMSDRGMNVLNTYFVRRFGFDKKDFSSSAFAKAINVPALIIHDKADSITRAAGSENIHKNWKNSRLLLTEGLTHSLYSEEVNDAILDFLAEEDKSI